MKTDLNDKTLFLGFEPSDHIRNMAKLVLTQIREATPKSYVSLILGRDDQRFYAIARLKIGQTHIQQDVDGEDVNQVLLRLQKLVAERAATVSQCYQTSEAVVSPSLKPRSHFMNTNAGRRT